MVERDRKTNVPTRSILSKGLRELCICLECESETRKGGETLGRKNRNVEKDFVTYGHVSKKTRSSEDMCDMTCSFEDT